MAVYPRYKDTELNWMTRLPSHWSIKKFKYLFKIRKTIAGKLGIDVLSITQKGIKVKDIESGKGQIALDYSKYQRVNEGEYAMNHMDLLTGYVDLSKYDGVTSPDYRVFSLEDAASNKSYYLYLLQLCYANKIFYPLGRGAAHIGRWRLPTAAFKEFKAPYPPLDEQVQIVEYLNRETTRIDNLIAEKQKLINLLKEKRQALVHMAISQSSTLMLPIQYCTTRMFRPIDMSVNETYVPIGLYNRGRGIFHKKPTLGKNLGDSVFYNIKSGDLILSGQFAWEGAVSLACIQENECIASHRYPVFRGKKDVLNTYFLWAYLTSRAGDFLLNEHSRGAAGRNRPLNVNTLRKEKIPVPLMETQLMVAKMVKKEQELIKAVKETEVILKEHRTALISAAVTGRIDVRNQV